MAITPATITLNGATTFSDLQLRADEFIPTSSFLTLVKPYCPDIPDPVAADAIRMAITELCERTKCWRHIVTVEITEQNQAVVAPEFTAIHLIETAEFNGRALTPTQFSTVDTSATGAAEYITQINPNTVALIPFEEGTLNLTLFLKPRHGIDFAPGGIPQDENAYNIAPRFLYETMAEPIANGALARLLEMKGHSYTDPSAAQQYRMRFNMFCDAHFNQSIRGQHRAQKRARYRDF